MPKKKGFLGLRIKKRKKIPGTRSKRKLKSMKRKHKNTLRELKEHKKQGGATSLEALTIIKFSRGKKLSEREKRVVVEITRLNGFYDRLKREQITHRTEAQIQMIKRGIANFLGVLCSKKIIPTTIDQLISLVKIYVSSLEEHGFRKEAEATKYFIECVQRNKKAAREFWNREVPTILETFLLKNK
jgi:hypothetical protein